MARIRIITTLSWPRNGRWTRRWIHRWSFRRMLTTSWSPRSLGRATATWRCQSTPSWTLESHSLAQPSPNRICIRRYRSLSLIQCHYKRKETSWASRPCNRSWCRMCIASSSHSGCHSKNSNQSHLSPLRHHAWESGRCSSDSHLLTTLLSWKSARTWTTMASQRERKGVMIRTRYCSLMMTMCSRSHPSITGPTTTGPNS